MAGGGRFVPPPGALYHGSIYDIPDSVKPSGKTGNSIWGRMGHEAGQPAHENAFATENESEAWHFAQQSHRMKTAVSEIKTKNGDPTPLPGRARVYSVAPNPVMKPGAYNPASPNWRPSMGYHSKEWVSPSFRVTGVHDIKPGHQGTFPEINWAEHARPGLGADHDVNHPTDLQIREGHKPRPPDRVIDL